MVSRSLDARTDAKSRVRVRPTFTRWPTHPTTITAAYSFGPHLTSSGGANHVGNEEHSIHNRCIFDAG